VAGDPGGANRDPYRRARVGLAGGLAAAAIVQVVLEPLMPGFHANPLILGLLLATAGGALGVDILSAIKGLLK